MVPLPNPRIIALVTTGLVLLLAAMGTPQAAPSFDCKKAKTPVEKEICAKKLLGDLDRALAKAYPNALARLGEDAEAVTSLKTSQRLFLVTRNAEFSPRPGNDYDLRNHMASQLDLLRSIGPDPRSGFEGEWKTTEGMIFIGPPQANGTSPVNATSRTHDSRRWTCEFLGEARRAGDSLIVEGRDKYKNEYANWRLKLTRNGRLLKLETLRPDGGTSAPFCGINGSLAGSYFQSDVMADNPCAGIPASQCRE